MKNQNKDARRLELQREIDALQTELNQLDTKISRVEDQLATEGACSVHLYATYTCTTCILQKKAKKKMF